MSYDKEWYENNRVTHYRRTSEQRRRRFRWKDELKAKPCMDCGGSFPPECMDFDHVRGIKVATINMLIASNSPREKVLAEIAKCDLVCANCHRIRTKQRRSSGEEEPA